MAGEPSPVASLRPAGYYLRLGQEHLAPAGKTALLGMGKGQGTGSRAGGSQPQLQAAHKLTRTKVKRLWPLTAGVSHAFPGPSAPAGHPLPSKGRWYKQRHPQATHYQGRHRGEQGQEDGMLSQRKGGHPTGPCSPAFLLPFPKSARMCHFRMHQAPAAAIQ